MQVIIEATPDEVLGSSLLIPHPRPSPSSKEYASNTADYDRKDGADLQHHSLAAKVSTIKEAPSKIVAPTPIYASWRNSLLTDSFVTDSPLPHSNPGALDHQKSPAYKRVFDVAGLPVEIICQIFEKFVEGDPRQNDKYLPRHLVSRRCPSDPIRMGQICSRWRTIALSRPELWSKIYIHNPNPSQIRPVRICLERSGNRLLDIGISYDGEDHKFDNRSASRILGSLHSRLEHWRDIKFQLPFQFLRTLLAMLQFDQRPIRLECASIGFMGSIGYPYEPKFDPYIHAIWNFFHRSPKLTQVDWRGRGVDNFPRHAPFKQLTHVRTNFTLSIDEVLAFLASVPRIQELSIESIRRKPQTELYLDDPPLFLQHLRALSVHSLSIRTGSLYSSLICPALETLKIDHNSLTYQPNQDLSEVIQFLQRSDCQLKALSIKDPHLSDDDLERLLPSPALCSLTSLSIRKNVIRDPFVRVLMKQLEDGTHVLLPRLERLLLNSCDTTDGLLASLITSRWYIGALPGALRWALVTPKKGFGFNDKAFFNTHELR